MGSSLKTSNKPRSPFFEMLESFWEPPFETCPRCGGKIVEYYDPFFFAPIRTLKGRRRIKCKTCKFVWRPSSRRKSLFDALNPFKN